MRKGIRIFAAAVCCIASVSDTTARQAREYFPNQPGVAWLYDIAFSLQDTVLQHQRLDSVVHVESSGGSEQVFVRSDNGPVTRYVLSGDTIKVGPSALGLAPLLEVIGIGVDDDAFQGLDAFRLNAPVNAPWTIRSVTRKLAVPEDLRTAIPSDSVETSIRIRGMRLPDGQVTTRLGSFAVRPFETYLRLSIRLQLGFIPITIHLIDELVLESHLAENRGIILQHSDAYNVENPLYPDEIIFTIPAQDVEMVEFRALPDVSIGLERPATVTLLSNYPNPFSSTTDIRFDLTEPQYVTLSAFDVLGRKVAVISDGLLLGPGSHSAQFAAGHLPPGIYFYRLDANAPNGSTSRLTGRMVKVP